jgi:hypothetical protein
MSKEAVHFEALGYEPRRTKPVHFAAGFFLSVAGGRYELESLNKAAVINPKNKGLLESYTHESLLAAFKESGVIDSAAKERELIALRIQLNGVVGNDDAIYGSFPPYKKPPGVAYTMVSDRVLYDHDPQDGYSGYFVHSVLNATQDGKMVVGFAKQCLDNHTSTLEQLIAPLLDADEPRDNWNCRYEERFGELDRKRLKQWAALMSPQTKALATLCRNLERGVSHSTKLRCLVMGLCSWLFIYLHKRAAKAHGLKSETPLLVMDFLGNTNARFRAASRLCFARQRGLVFESYRALRDAGAVDFDDEIFAGKSASGGQPDFKFLEEHYSDLAVRIGFAQPRSWQARRKHFELQPDTARMLLLSVIMPDDPLVTFEVVAAALRDVWGVWLGGCDNDLAALRQHGYEGLDEDADLEPNRDAFVDMLKRLNLATEPSDGLVLCAVNPEELP